MKVILFLLLLVHAALAKITIDIEKNDTLMLSTLKVLQEKKVIFKDTKSQFYEVFEGDINKDGIKEKVLLGWSGGAHCCFKLYIINFKKKNPSVSAIFLNNAYEISFKDLDNDGIKEWIFYDDSYSYFLSSFVNSPWIKIVASYKNEKLILRPKLIGMVNKNKTPLKKVSIKLDKNGFLTVSDEEKLAPIVESFLFYFYSGHLKKAINVLKQNILFENRGVKLLFLQELTQSIHESYFWKQLLRMHHFYEKAELEGYEDEYYSANDVARELFVRLEQ